MKKVQVNLDMPWRLLPLSIKDWIRENGYLIRESPSGGATVLTDWQEAYRNRKRST